MQENYKTYHEQAFDSDGSFSEQKWKAFPDSTKEGLCESALSDKIFLGMMLFLWTLRMLQEYREINRLRRHISSLPTCKRHDDMVNEVQDDDLPNGERHELICL